MPDFIRYYDDLKTKTFGHQLYYFNELASTNTWVKDIPDDIASHGAVCLTDWQTNGRGQHSKKWDSENGKSLTFSVVLKPQYINRLQLLVQVMALVLTDELEHQFKTKTDIKWPNDILYKNQKIAGILAEGIFTGTKLERFVVGVGINIGEGDYIQSLGDVNCLEKITGTSCDSTRLLAGIITRFEEYYDRWTASDKELIKKINHRIIGFCNWNKVQVNGHFKDKLYKFLGLDVDGYPLFLTSTDEIKKVTHQHIRIFPQSDEH